MPQAMRLHARGPEDVLASFQFLQAEADTDEGRSAKAFTELVGGGPVTIG